MSKKTRGKNLLSLQAKNKDPPTIILDSTPDNVSGTLRYLITQNKTTRRETRDTLGAKGEAEEAEPVQALRESLIIRQQWRRGYRTGKIPG